jgi:hypothetical protein
MEQHAFRLDLDEGRWPPVTGPRRRQAATSSPLPPAVGDTAPVGGALDPDLGLSPLFNSMPVLRHGPHGGGSADDFLMVWISVPDLSIHASPQRYTFAERLAYSNKLVRFESVGEDDDFVAQCRLRSQGPGRRLPVYRHR